MDEDQNNIDINSLFARVAEAESIAQSALDMVDGLEKTVKANELRNNTLTELVDDQVATIESLKESLTTNTQTISENQKSITELSAEVESEKQERKLLFDLQEDRRFKDQDTLQKQQRSQQISGGGTTGARGGAGGAAGAGGAGGAAGGGGAGGGIGGGLARGLSGVALGTALGATGVAGGGKRGPLGFLGGTLDFLTGGVTDADRMGGDPNFIGKMFGGGLDILTGQKFDFDQQGDSVIAAGANPLFALSGLQLLNPKVRKRMKELKEEGLTGNEALREAKLQIQMESKFNEQEEGSFKNKKERRKEKNNKFEMKKEKVFNEEKEESKDKGLFGGLFNFGKKEKKISQPEESIKSDLTTITFDGKTVPRGLSGPMETFGGKGGSTYEDEEDVKPEKKKGLFGGLLGFNKGGEVEDNDKDTSNNDEDSVPALLTPGEFVIKKDAVQNIGVETLQGINDAAGKSTFTPFFLSKNRNEKGDLTTYSKFGEKSEEVIESADGSYKSSTITDMTGGGFDEISTETYKKTETDAEGNVITFAEESKMREKISAIGVSDLIEHQDQLLGEIHKLKGYENVTIEQIINGTSGMPQEKLLPILLRSDAQKATSDKQEQAINLDLEEGTDQSLQGTTGYRRGQLSPEELITASTELTDKTQTKIKKSSDPSNLEFDALSESINANVQRFSEGGLVGESTQTNIKEIAEKIKPKLQKMAESLRMDENHNVDFTSILGKDKGEKMNQTFSGFIGIIKNDVIPIVETLKSNSKIQPSSEDTRENEFGDELMEPLEDDEPFVVPEMIQEEEEPAPPPIESLLPVPDALPAELSETENFMPFIQLIKNRSIQVM